MGAPWGAHKVSSQSSKHKRALSRSITRERCLRNQPNHTRTLFEGPVQSQDCLVGGPYPITSEHRLRTPSNHERAMLLTFEDPTQSRETCCEEPITITITREHCLRSPSNHNRVLFEDPVQSQASLRAPYNHKRALFEDPIQSQP